MRLAHNTLRSVGAICLLRRVLIESQETLPAIIGYSSRTAPVIPVTENWNLLSNGAV